MGTTTKLLGSTMYEKLVLTNGAIHAGEFTFVSDGAICAYPRFVRDHGHVFFLQAVAIAIPKKK